MARKQKQDKLETLYSTVQANPGRKAGGLANLLGWHRSDVSRTLPALEERGYMLSEDRNGRLWPFGKRQN